MRPTPELGTHPFPAMIMNPFEKSSPSVLYPTSRPHPRHRSAIFAVLLVLSLTLPAFFLVSPVTGGAVGNSPLADGSNPSLTASSAEHPSSSNAPPCAGSMALAPCPQVGSSDVDVNWTNLTSYLSPAPSARDDAASAYDAATQSILLFGGHMGSATWGDTWSFANGSWTSRSPPVDTSTNTPSPRWGASMAYDPLTGSVILFGGRGGQPFYNDTWEWKGGAWENLVVPKSPPARDFATMAFDPALGVLVLFGGNNGAATSAFNDTWEFDGSTWTNVTGSVGPTPPGRYGAGAAYDPNAGAIVLFGGYNPTAGDLNDTWTFNATGWKLVVPLAGGPGPRSDPQMAYDDARGDVMLYGGVTPSGSRWGDLWRYSNGTWSQQLGSENGTLVARAGGTMVDLLTPNPPGSVMVLFGGSVSGSLSSRAVSSETWLYGATLPLGATTPRSLRNIYDNGQSFQISSHAFGGTPPYSYDWVGLPPGCASVNASELACAPNPQPNPAGVAFTVTLLVSDHVGSSIASGSAIFTLSPAPTILAFYTVPAIPTTGVAFTLVVNAQGGAGWLNYSYVALPSGCPISNTNVSTLTCTTTQAAVYSVLVSVTDALGAFAEANATIDVTSPSTSAGGVTTTELALGVAVEAVVAVVIVVVVYRRGRAPPPAPPRTP
jgi:hypothetical protein